MYSVTYIGDSFIFSCTVLKIDLKKIKVHQNSKAHKMMQLMKVSVVILFTHFLHTTKILQHALENSWQ